jgi:hypothetical protein
MMAQVLLYYHSMKLVRLPAAEDDSRGPFHEKRTTKSVLMDHMRDGDQFDLEGPTSAELMEAVKKEEFFTKLLETEEQEDGTVLHYAWRMKEQPLFLAIFLGNIRGKEILRSGPRMLVEPTILDVKVDGGAVAQKYVNYIDCDKTLSMYLMPFIRLYEDTFYWWQVRMIK